MGNCNSNPGSRMLGTKFYTYHGDDTKATVYRLIKYKDSNKTYSLQNVDTSEIIHITEDELTCNESEFVMLNPDGILNFIIVSVGADNKSKDVLVVLHRKENGEISSTPYAVCRQGIEDIFINNTLAKKDNNLYIGASISRDTCPENIDFNIILACNEIVWIATTAVYFDDGLEDFNKYLFSGVNIKKFDTVLLNEANKITNGYQNVKGSCRSMMELLTSNSFMHDFHSAFNILEVSFTINPEQETLLEQQHYMFEIALTRRIGNTYVTPYSRDIDLSQINRSYVLCTYNSSPDIYIIGYDELDDKTYIPKELLI